MLYKQRSHDGHESSRLTDATRIMSSSSTTTTAKRQIDSDELIKFAKNTSNLIRNVLEKVHQIPRAKQVKKKSKRLKPLTHHQPDVCRQLGKNQALTSSHEPSHTPTAFGKHTTPEKTDRPVRESCSLDLPLGYFMHNMYEEEELSVENLLPSLRPEDFPTPENTYQTNVSQYSSQQMNVHSF